MTHARTTDARDGTPAPTTPIRKDIPFDEESEPSPQLSNMALPKNISHLDGKGEAFVNEVIKPGRVPASFLPSKEAKLKKLQPEQSSRNKVKVA